MRWPRVVVHADMDAFYASVEQRDDPSLRGKPVIVGGSSRRGVVLTASYEARPFGVGSAMSMARALRQCPQAVVVPPHFDRYVEVSRKVMDVFHDFSPTVEALSLDEAFLDMTGAEGLFGSPEDMGRKLRAAVKAAVQLNVSVGISTTKYVAKVASDFRKPDGLTLVPEAQVRHFLDPLPVQKLWGVGPKTVPRLHAIGLRTVGDVARASPSWLTAQLGSLGDHVRRLSLGEDPREVIPDRDGRSTGHDRTLEHDVIGVEAITPHLRHAADDVAHRLRRSGILAHGVRVKLKTRDFQIHTRQKKLDEGTDSAGPLLDAALSLLPAFDLSEPMRLVGLAAFDLGDARAPRQGDLFADPGLERRRKLDRALDAVREKFGDAALRRASDAEED
jgi:DNA polymerase-4